LSSSHDQTLSLIVASIRRLTWPAAATADDFACIALKLLGDS
jgi:hypothetical protein